MQEFFIQATSKCLISGKKNFNFEFFEFDEEWLRAIWAAKLTRIQKMVMIYLFGKINSPRELIENTKLSSVYEVAEQTGLEFGTVLNTLQELTAENYLTLEQFNIRLDKNIPFSYQISEKIFAVC